MSRRFIMRCKDFDIGYLDFELNEGKIYDNFDQRFVPARLRNLNKSNNLFKEICEFYRRRMIPVNNDLYSKVLEDEGIIGQTLEEFLLRNKGMSTQDYYWATNNPSDDYCECHIREVPHKYMPVID